MKTTNLTTIAIVSTLLLLSPTKAQGNWGEPVSIKDFYVVINAIRTRPSVFSERIRGLFRDRRTNNVHNNFVGKTYTDASINNMINYFDTIQAVEPVALDRGLTMAGYEQATYMGSINNFVNLNAQNQNLDARVTSWGNHTGGIGEAQMLSFPGGKMAEIMVLDYMLQSDANRDMIRNPNWRLMGVGSHKRINDYFINIIFANQFVCGRCHTITDKMEDDSFWNQYLRDTYNPPDTDGNLRVNRMAFMTKFAAGLLLAFFGILAM